MSQSLAGISGQMITSVEVRNPDGGLIANHTIKTVWKELPETLNDKWRQIEFSHSVDDVILSSGIVHNMQDIKERHNNYAGHYNFGGKVDRL